MMILDVISRITHVSTAIVLVGGSVFVLFMLLPATAVLSADQRTTFSEKIQSRWKRFVHTGVLLFLVSGFYNYYRAVGLHKGDGPYHMLLGIKMLLAFGVFFLASAMVGRSAKLATFRENRGKWLRVLVLLAAIIVSISGYVKVRGVPGVSESDDVAELN